jgi:hypothetical protein
MDILALMPKTPSKPVPLVLILLDYPLKLPYTNPKEPSQKKYAPSRKPPPLISLFHCPFSSFISSPTHLLSYPIINAPYPYLLMLLIPSVYVIF